MMADSSDRLARFRHDVHEAVVVRLEGTPAADVEAVCDVAAVLIAKAAAAYRLRSLDRSRFLAIAASAWDECDDLVRFFEAAPEGTA